MKLILNKNKLTLNLPQFLRQSGYAFHQDRNTGKESFIRPLGRGFYPRLHLYYEETSDKFILNLHLDQKQASYAGAHMHNGEYDGEIVGGEIDRLKQLIVNSISANKKVVSVEDKISAVKDQFSMLGHGEIEEEPIISRNNNWFRKILNFFRY